MTSRSVQHSADGPGVHTVGVGVAIGAQLIGVGQTLVKQLIRTGQLRAIKIGRRTIIPVAEIEAFVQRRLDGD